MGGEESNQLSVILETERLPKSTPMLSSHCFLARFHAVGGALTSTGRGCDQTIRNRRPLQAHGLRHTHSTALTHIHINHKPLSHKAHTSTVRKHTNNPECTCCTPDERNEVMRGEGRRKRGEGAGLWGSCPSPALSALLQFPGGKGAQTSQPPPKYHREAGACHTPSPPPSALTLGPPPLTPNTHTQAII